jgi:hypothetical protein
MNEKNKSSGKVRSGWNTLLNILGYALAILVGGFVTMLLQQH